MVNVYFKRSNGERILIGSCEKDMQECLKIINKYLENYPNFKSYYTRIWTEPDDKLWHCPVTWFDVGSHTEFFLATGIDMKDFADDRGRKDENFIN